MPLYLALDQSTSATKALLFDAAGECLDREAREHQQHYPQPGWVEHDADEIWRNTKAILGNLLRRQGARRDEIVSLSLTNQRETIVAFDRQTGTPLGRAIVWQCRRGAERCAQEESAGRGAFIHGKTGLKLDPYFSGSKLAWLMREQPAVAARLRDGSAVVGTIDAYLVHRLTGGRVFATDHTNASRTLLYNLTTLNWDDELCAFWEVPRSALPEIRESRAQFGETDLEKLLPRSIPICGVMGDSQAALFAQRCFEPGSAKVTFGTGSSVLMNIGAKPILSEHGVLTALSWVDAGQPTYAFEGLIISSASTLTWLRDQLALATDVPALEALAKSVPDNAGVYLVPAFTGLGLPYWKPEARATISGLTPHSQRTHLARAGFESIAYQVRDALDAMRREARAPLGVVRADGGPTASAFLMQFTADITHTELRVAAMPDCSPLGAVLAAQLGLGHSPSLASLAASARADRAYHPALPRARADVLYAGWQSAVRQLLAS